MKKYYLVLLLPLFFTHTTLLSQTEQENDWLNVFVDCRTYCDINYFKQEINFINYVRDKAIADVHILVTPYRMASGGNRYDFEFIGQNNNQTSLLSYQAPPQVNSDKLRQEMVRVIKMGLIPYLSTTSLAGGIEINVDVPREKVEALTVPQEDPWKQWVFEMGANGNISLEKSRRSFNWRLGGEIDRVTENWRINQDIYYNLNTTYFEDEEETITGRRERYGLNGRIVKSISDHWSAGLFEGISSTTFDNINLGLRLGPALEYSVFPYREVTTREITVAYFNRVYYRDYIEETIYGVEQENLWDQALAVTARFRRPWGSLFSRLEGRHFFHDLSKNSLELYNRVSLQVVKGFNFNVTTNFEFINDQLYLPAGEASLEDILLQQRQLSTNYEFYFAMGVSYTFGSIYNNIINTRL